MKTIFRKSTIGLLSGAAFTLALMLAPSTSNAFEEGDEEVVCYCTSNGKCAANGTGNNQCNDSRKCWKWNNNCD